MPSSSPFYDDDLAYIQEEGYRGSAEAYAPGLLRILADAGIREGLVVDLGCGSGVWAKHLCDAGYRTVGLDVSPALIQRARQRASSAEFRVGSLWSYRIPRCRAVTALGEVVCYRVPNGGQQQMGSLFRKTFNALHPGGLLIFDVAEIGLDRHRRQACLEGADWACLVRFEYDEKKQRLCRHITTFRRLNGLFRRSKERHVVQLYEADEVARVLRKTGFRVRRARRFGAYSLLTRRVAFIARKP